MSGRGGGGRGGRGGGAGRGGLIRALAREQQNELGPSTNSGGGVETPATICVTQPPPLYARPFKMPVAREGDSETEDMIKIYNEYIDWFQQSPAYLRLPGEEKSGDLEVDRLMALIPKQKMKYDWKMFPEELRPKQVNERLKRIAEKEAADKQGEKSSTAGTVNPLQRLDELQQLEEGDADSLASDEDDKEEEEDDDMDVIQRPDGDDEDEEMDEGTDYLRSYFDNGENDEDENDDMDEGPIY